MARPVFLSMGGKPDTKFAKEVKDLLPDAMVYFYERTGEEGVKFRTEIEAAIQGCRLFVVFWSDDYLASDAAKLELALFKKLVDAGGDKDLLIVPTKRKHPNIQGKWKNPITQADAEYVLGRWRYERAVYKESEPQRVAENIRRKLEKAELVDRALVARPQLLTHFKAALSLPAKFQTVQFGFVQGYEGDGRRTALRQYMTSAHVNLTPRYIPLDTTEGPEDLLLRLLDRRSPKERTEIIEAARQKPGGVGKAIRTAIFEAAESKSYCVFALSRFTAADSGTLPFWFADVFSSISAGNAPIAFMVVPNPITDAQMKHYPHAARIRVPGLDENEMEELVYKLAAEDPDPKRWTQEQQKTVAKVSGSSPSLCHSIMYSMSIEQNLDFLRRIADREAEMFSANISALVGHLVQQLKNRPSDLLALRIIERLGPTSKHALEQIFASRGISEPFDLYQLRDFGLVEQLSGDIYRIPPLVQRRLGDALWAAGGREDLDAALAAFANCLLDEKDDYGAVFASNKVAAQLRSGSPVSAELDLYLTTATLFKAGLERYTNNEFATAHPILQRAMRRLFEGAVVDPLTQIEIARYYGLVSARQESFDEVRVACDFLQGMSVKARAVQAEAMVHFLHGFQARVQWHHRDAVREFESARDRLHGVSYAERQRGAILTELSRALLRLDPPAYERAVAIAQEAYDQTKVVHNLNGLIRARLARLAGEFFGNDERFRKEVGDLEGLLSLLTEMCERSGQDFHLVRRADLSRTLAFKRKASGESPQLDLTEAIRFVDDALRLKRFAPTVSRRWYLKLFDQSTDHSTELAREIEPVLRDATKQDRVHLKDAITVAVIVSARRSSEDAKAVLRRYGDYVNDGLRRHLNQLIKSHGFVGDSTEEYARLDRY